jgi:hypothetical protein
MLPRKYTKGIQSVMPLYTHRYERTQLNSHKSLIFCILVVTIGKDYAIQIVPCRHVSHFCHNLFYLYSPHVCTHTHMYIWYMQKQNSYVLMLKVWSCIDSYPFIFVRCCQNGDVRPATVSDKCKYYMHSTNYPRYNVFLQ